MTASSYTSLNAVSKFCTAILFLFREPFKHPKVLLYEKRKEKKKKKKGKRGRKRRKSEEKNITGEKMEGNVKKKRSVGSN